MFLDIHVIALMSPFLHAVNLLSKAREYSLALDLFHSFCSRRLGITIIALKVVVFKGESSTHALRRRVVSSMKDFPLFPHGYMLLETLNNHSRACSGLYRLFAGN